MLNWQISNEWDGLMKNYCIVKLVMCHILSLKDSIMRIRPCQALLPESSILVSDIVGLVKFSA